MKKSWLLFSILIALNIQTIKAQELLTVNREFTINSQFDFNGEWHYLTSDLYLFNASKFQSLLNDLYPVPPKKKKIAYDAPQNILLTAQVIGTPLPEITYPVFNFNVKDSDQGLTTFISESYEAVRLIDNLPITSLTNKKADCKINIEVITKENSNKLFDFIASQLKTVSSWTTAPLSTAQTVIGELSKLLSSKTTGKDFKFNSTVRLYDEQDFNKRVSSISLYSFLPSNIHRAAVDSTHLSEFMRKEENPQVDKNKLSQLIKYYGYPYIVIVNYKSKYVTEPVIGDETNSETVKARLSKVKRQYDNGLLSTALYEHELKLINYLEAFVDLKQSIDIYKLNYKNRINDDFSRLFLTIFSKFRSLKNIYDIRLKEFSKDGIFINEFLPTYQSIMTNAEVYLEGDNNLKNLKNMVIVLCGYSDKTNTSKIDSKRIENDLSILHTVEFPKGAFTEDCVTELENVISKLETSLYQNVFATKTAKLQSMPPSPQATAFCEALKNDLNNTYCKLCREKANEAVNDYTQRLSKENDRIAQEKLSLSISNAKDIIFNVLQKEKIIQKHFDEDYKDGLSTQEEFILEDFKKLQSLRSDLVTQTKKDLSGLTPTQKDILTDEIHYKTQDLAKILEQICKRMPQLCTE